MTFMNRGRGHHSPLGRVDTDEISKNTAACELPSGVLTIVKPHMNEASSTEDDTKQAMDAFI
jgi:hypothetical protein